MDDFDRRLNERAQLKAAGDDATAAAALRRTREQSTPAAVPAAAGDEMAELRKRMAELQDAGTSHNSAPPCTKQASE